MIEWHQVAQPQYDPWRERWVGRAGRWEAVIHRIHSGECELTIHHEDTPSEAAGSVVGRKPAWFSRHPTRQEAERAAEEYVAAHAGQNEPDLSATEVEWMDVTPDHDEWLRKDEAE